MATTDDNDRKIAERKAPSGFVTVACKIGVPWIDFQVCTSEIVKENTQTGPRDVIEWQKTGRVIRIRGTAYPRGEAPEGFPDKPTMIAGCALTHNVPRAEWEEIAKQHAKAPYFENNLIFAYERIEDVQAKAKEHASELSGLEPLQRAKAVEGGEVIDVIRDPRMPKAPLRGVGQAGEPVKG
jgi:hypothetical protein